MNRQAFSLLLLTTLFLFGSMPVSADESEKSAKAKPKDRYHVPEGDVAAVAKFLDALMVYRPKTTDEILAYRQKAQKAMESAADKILELEKDTASKAYRKAVSVKLQLDLTKLQTGTEEYQADYYERVAKHMDAGKSLGKPDLALVYTMSQILEQTGNLELAGRSNAKYGAIFEKNEDGQLANFGKMMSAVARRMALVGNEMKIDGTTLDGDKFDWKAYRGKVVLVDFWATWCGPCVAELPNVLENYKKYHDKGFEVVAISLDDDRDRLEKFVDAKDLPWVCLFEDGVGTSHPMAEYYGVTGIPTVMLVDRKGKVVSMSARGGQLERELIKLLGPQDEAAGE
jgi:thiol-disulfide isomerase/thioredoxin